MVLARPPVLWRVLWRPLHRAQGGNGAVWTQVAHGHEPRRGGGPTRGECRFVAQVPVRVVESHAEAPEGARGGFVVLEGWATQPSAAAGVIMAGLASELPHLVAEGLEMTFIAEQDAEPDDGEGSWVESAMGRLRVVSSTLF